MQEKLWQRKRVNFPWNTTSHCNWYEQPKIFCSHSVAWCRRIYSKRYETFENKLKKVSGRVNILHNTDIRLFSELPSAYENELFQMLVLDPLPSPTLDILGYIYKYCPQMSYFEWTNSHTTPKSDDIKYE